MMMLFDNRFDHNSDSPEKDDHLMGPSDGKTEMRDKAYNICREFLSGSWKKISRDDMIFKSVR